MQPGTVPGGAGCPVSGATQAANAAGSIESAGVEADGVQTQARASIRGAVPSTAVISPTAYDGWRPRS